MNEWRRVSPVAIVYFAVASIPSLTSMWPLILGVWVAGENMQQWFLSYGVYLLLLLLFLFIVLRYWFFRFKVESDRIQLHSGIFRRKRLTLEFDRVQQADIAQPFYFRPFGLSTLGLESAGSSEQEVYIPGIRLVEAERLKTQILAHREPTEDDSAASAVLAREQVEPDYQLRLPPAEVARYGLMHNGLLFILPLIAPLAQNWLVYAEEWMASLDHAAVNRLLSAVTDDGLVWLMVVGGIIAAIGGIAVIFAISAAIALVRYWDYHLTCFGEQYQYRAGLMTIRTRSFRWHKVQLMTVSQGIIARLLKRHTLSFSKAGGATGDAQQESNRFLIPVLTDQARLEVEQQLRLPNPVWTRVHALYVPWRAVTSGTLFFVLIGAMLLAAEQAIAPAVLSYPICLLIAWRRWQCLGYYQDAAWLAVRTGFIGRQVQWLPVVKTQKLSLARSPWLLYLGLANLQAWGASGRLFIPFVPLSTAETLRDNALRSVVTFKGRWL